MAQTELQPAEIIPFRQYDYSDTYFEKGKQVLQGTELPFERVSVGSEDVDSTDYLYVRLGFSPVYRQERGRG